MKDEGEESMNKNSLLVIYLFSILTEFELAIEMSMLSSQLHRHQARGDYQSRPTQ